MNKRWNTCVAAVDVLREAIKGSDLEVKNSNMILPEKEGTAKAIVTIKNPDFDEVDSLRTVGEAAKAKAEEAVSEDRVLYHETEVKECKIEGYF